MTRGVWFAAAALAVVVFAVSSGCGSSSNPPDGGSGGGSGLHCPDATEKTPPNVIDDPGFECSASNAPTWEAIYGTLDFPTGSAHSGTTNARVTAGSGGSARLAYVADVATDAGSNVYCASVWAKGTAPFMRLQVMNDSQVNQFSAPLTASWTKVPPSIMLDAANMDSKHLYLIVEAQIGRADGMNSQPGDTLEVDDVDIWVSPGGQCKER